MDWPILSLVTFLPLVGVALIAFVPADNPENSRRVALWVSLGTFLVSLLIWFNFDRTTADMQFVEEAAWMPIAGISYRVGVDGISMLFVLLTTLLTPLCILASWEAIKVRVKEYMIAFLILETFMVGMFVALDLFLFYIFFEAVLIPMFIIMGASIASTRAGSSAKRPAATAGPSITATTPSTVTRVRTSGQPKA